MLLCRESHLACTPCAGQKARRRRRRRRRQKKNTPPPPTDSFSPLPLTIIIIINHHTTPQPISTATALTWRLRERRVVRRADGAVAAHLDGRRRFAKRSIGLTREKLNSNKVNPKAHTQEKALSKTFTALQEKKQEKNAHCKLRNAPPPPPRKASGRLLPRHSHVCHSRPLPSLSLKKSCVFCSPPRASPSPPPCPSPPTPPPRPAGGACSGSYPPRGARCAPARRCRPASPPLRSDRKFSRPLLWAPHAPPSYGHCLLCAPPPPLLDERACVRRAACCVLC